MAHFVPVWLSHQYINLCVTVTTTTTWITLETKKKCWRAVSEASKTQFETSLVSRSQIPRFCIRVDKQWCLSPLFVDADRRKTDARPTSIIHPRALFGGLRLESLLNWKRDWLKYGGCWVVRNRAKVPEFWWRIEVSHGLGYFLVFGETKAQNTCLRLILKANIEFNWDLRFVSWTLLTSH